MTQEADEDPEGIAGEMAYVALLHGQDHAFYLYALLLGHRLWCLDPETPRVLMVGKAIKAEPAQKVQGKKPTPDYPSPFLESPARQTLAVMWQVREVDLIDAAIADKTSRKRHRFVFTKLRAFEVPYRKIIFFDLDIIVRRSPKELFKVEAPAGMYHGRWDRKDARHGEILPTEAFHDGFRVMGCINAGLMRLDPLGSKAERRKQVDDLVRKVSELTENDQTYLPEQYFLVKELPGWHHIEVAWNCEVNAEWYVQPEPRKNRRNKDKPDKPKVQLSEMPADWWQLSNEGNVEQLRRTVGMFHFSGIWLHPWWYIHLQPDQAFTLIQKQFAYRDRRGMVALAVSDWLSALEDLRECKDIQGEQATYLLNIIDDLAWCSSCWWEVAEPCGENCTWYKDETICEECLVKAKLSCTQDGSCNTGSNKKRPRPPGKRDKDRVADSGPSADSRKVSDATASEISSEIVEVPGPSAKLKDAKIAKGKKPRGRK